MSRPPSRTDNFVDLSTEHAQATIQTEDDDLKQAMAESMKDMSGQENGTISTGQHFGPAQRDHYPTAQWALAPIASSREMVDHPPPAKRQRIPGQPAFLQGSRETGYNAPLLNIYHSIPLAREALLFPALPILEYGYNPEWWSGTSDENTKALSILASCPGDEDRRKFSAEMQCLMAFLDNTTRAYGSVDALSEMRFYQYFRPESTYTKLCETWREASMEESRDEPLTQVFTSVAARGPEFQGASPEEKDMFQIEGAAFKEAHTQAEVLDKIFWGDQVNLPLEDVWMERFAHILTLRLFNDELGATKLGIMPTETWYLDRYMPEGRETVFQMRQQRYAILRDVEKLNRTKQRLASMPGLRTSMQSVSIRKALETAKEVLPVAVDETLRSESRLVEVSAQTDASRMQTQIDVLLADVEEKVKILEERQVNLESQIRDIMSDLTDPDHSSMPLKHKYVLQGASTKPNITYFRKLNHDLIGMEDNEEPHEVWQWWRTAWGEAAEQQASQSNGASNDVNAAGSTTPFSIRRVSVQEVREAVRDEHSTAMLVYADEAAMQFPVSSLPISLRKFVEQDNRAFGIESSQGHVQHVGRQRTWSNETNSTVMDDSNPFDDDMAPGQDATPMSTSTIRSLSGQPSPKRPRSSDESMQTISLMDDPPSYEDSAGDRPQEAMAEKKGNKIGYFAEQLLQNVEEREQKG